MVSLRDKNRGIRGTSFAQEDNLQWYSSVGTELYQAQQMLVKSLYLGFSTESFIDRLHWSFAHLIFHRINGKESLKFGMETYLNGRGPLMGDNLRSKTTFNGTQPLMKDDRINERRRSMEDNLWWNAIIDERPSLMEEDLQWKKTFNGRQPSLEDDHEDNLWWKTTLDGKWPSMKD